MVKPKSISKYCIKYMILDCSNCNTNPTRMFKILLIRVYIFVCLKLQSLYDTKMLTT